MKIRKYTISRQLLAILCVGIFVIALAALAFLYMGEVQEKEDLEQELAQVENQIKTINVNIESSELEKDALEAELARTMADTAGIKTQLSTSLDTSDIFQDMLSVASASKVSLTIIGETAIQSGTIGEVPYHLRTIDFRVSGKASDIYNFVNKLSKELNTSILNTVNMTAGSNPGAVTEANMRLNIYSY